MTEAEIQLSLSESGIRRIGRRMKFSLSKLPFLLMATRRTGDREINMQGTIFQIIVVGILLTIFPATAPFFGLGNPSTNATTLQHIEERLTNLENKVNTNTNNLAFITAFITGGIKPMQR